MFFLRTRGEWWGPEDGSDDGRTWPLSSLLGRFLAPLGSRRKSDDTQKTPFAVEHSPGRCLYKIVTEPDFNNDNWRRPALSDVMLDGQVISNRQSW